MGWQKEPKQPKQTGTRGGDGLGGSRVFKSALSLRSVRIRAEGGREALNHHHATKSCAPMPTTLRLRRTDPTEGVKRPTLKNKDGIATWSEDDIAAFRAHLPLGSMERLALELLLNTAQRRGDVVRMGRQHVRALKD
jgi:hypothetical protein